MCRLENASLSSFLARKMEYRFVLLSLTRGATEVSYQESTPGARKESPTYCRTTNGFGFTVLVANALPSSSSSVYGRVTRSPFLS